MIPSKLEYLEILPPSPTSCPAPDHWALDEGLNPIEVDTLVLVDRSWGIRAGIMEDQLHDWESVIDMGYRFGEHMVWDTSIDPLHKLVTTFSGVKRLIVRLEPRIFEDIQGFPPDGHNSASDLGDRLKTAALSGLEELVVELAQEDGWSFGASLRQAYIVSGI